MDITALIDFITQVGIWAALFLFVFIQDRESTKEREKKFDKREEDYINFIKEQGLRLEQISNTLESINERLEEVEEKISDNALGGKYLS